MDAISSYDLPDSPAWDDLAALSTHTTFDVIEAVPEGVFESGVGRFEAVATVYVGLQYGKDNDEGFSSTEEFPALVKGSLTKRPDGYVADIDDISVDTSAFYE
jgi:hypothetical protein